MQNVVIVVIYVPDHSAVADLGYYAYEYSLFSTLVPLHTAGRLEVNMSEVSLEDVERSLLESDPGLTLGGYWKPKDCLPRWKVRHVTCSHNRHHCEIYI